MRLRRRNLPKSVGAPIRAVTPYCLRELKLHTERDTAALGHALVALKPQDPSAHSRAAPWRTYIEDANEADLFAFAAYHFQAPSQLSAITR
jgi:hypothetical protein